VNFEIFDFSKSNIFTLLFIYLFNFLQGCIKLIQSNSNQICNVTKDYYFKLILLIITKLLNGSVGVSFISEYSTSILDFI